MLFDKEIKKLGFGLMRLPRIGDKIDIEAVKALTDRFLAEGFTYFDTARVYDGSEDAIRQALVERYPRESFQLATKNAAWVNCRTREEAIAQFNASLEATGAGYFDMYLLHNLGQRRTHYFDDFKMWDFVKEKKEEGLIRHYGLSAHATPDELRKILDDHPDAEFIQLQLNFADWENPAVCSAEVYKIAREHSLPIIVMEPVKGGTLAKLPPQVMDILREYDPDRSAAEWALRFAASLDGVVTVLSGMNTMEQMEENISFMKDFKPFTEEEFAVIERAREELSRIPVIPCTSCDYCAKVCPENIGISATFAAVNTYTLYHDLAFSQNQEWANVLFAGGKKRATECIKCGACEETCPQQIKIRDELEKAVETLELK